MKDKGPKSRAASSPAAHTADHKETWIEQSASFIGFFIYLLILKSFFLPLFIIPTGSMAQTLYGAHAVNTCPNCGVEYPVGWQQSPSWPAGLDFHPWAVQCPNCRWQQYCDYGQRSRLTQQGLQPDEILSSPLRPSAGDRIFVHGWPYDSPLAGLDGFGPARWDVVVFKVPTDGQTNYIKRLIGLPGETIELIDGDLFVNDQLAQKTRDAQKSLWFPYYDHDHAPQKPSSRTGYHPRWVALTEDGAWSDLKARTLSFGGVESPRAELQFATDPQNPTWAGLVQDVYSYNEPRTSLTPPLSFKYPQPLGQYHIVKDVRISTEVEITHANEGGYVELSLTNREHRFYARLMAGGRVVLEHSATRGGMRETWGEWTRPQSTGPVRLALCHVDGRVAVEVDDQPIAALQSTPAQYELTSALARGQSKTPQTPTIRIAAEHVQASLQHILIERDVFYTSDAYRPDSEVYAMQDHPIALGPNDYFMLGDNSPNSLDGRFAFAGQDQNPIGPHLREAAAEGRFQRGTVPRDQLLGRAFFVYWPGFLPLTSAGPNLLPDLGRARWIR